MNITYHSSSVHIEVVETAKVWQPVCRGKEAEGIHRLPEREGEEGFEWTAICFPLYTNQNRNLLEGKNSVQRSTCEDIRKYQLSEYCHQSCRIQGPWTGGLKIWKGNVPRFQRQNAIKPWGRTALPKPFIEHDDRFNWLDCQTAFGKQQGIVLLAANSSRGELIEQLRTAIESLNVFADWRSIVIGQRWGIYWNYCAWLCIRYLQARTICNCCRPNWEEWTGLLCQ